MVGREQNMRDCFLDHTVIFYYLNNVQEFNDLLEIYPRKKANYTENDLGEMDDVSGLADRSN